MIMAKFNSNDLVGYLSLLLGQFLPLSRSEREQNSFNQRMAEDAYNRQIDFYERFNSPSSMVQQYEDAGINPALVAGYSPSSPPSSQAASGNGGSPALGALQLALEMKMKGKELSIQKDVADAQIRNIDADTALKNENAENKRFENLSAEEFYKLRNASLLGSIRLSEEQSSTEEEKRGLYHVQQSLLHVDFRTRDRLNELRINILELQKEYQESANEQLSFQVEMQAETYFIQMRNIIAQTSLSNAHATQIREYAKTMLQTEYVDADGKKYLNLLAAMTDNEINSLRKDNKAKWATNYVKPLASALALVGGVGIGLAKILSPAKVMALPISLESGYGSFSEQYGTFDTNIY